MDKQGSVWAGDFGDGYTERNIINYQNHLPIWLNVVRELGPTFRDLSMLEVGCNRGHNLTALSFLGVDYLVGIDINNLALSKARKNHSHVRYGNILEIPFDCSSFDLVFTMGVLIHIAPENLATAIREVYRVSKRFVLAIEYPADEEIVVPYRGNDDMLWKRDFQKEFTTVCPDLQLMKHWSWGTKEKPFYDRVDGWLFEKGIHYGVLNR